MKRKMKEIIILIIFLVGLLKFSPADELYIPSRFGQEIDEILYWAGCLMYVYPEGIWIDLGIVKIPLDELEPPIGDFVNHLCKPVINQKVKFRPIFRWKRLYLIKNYNTVNQ